jgi:integrase
MTNNIERLEAEFAASGDAEACVQQLAMSYSLQTLPTKLSELRDLYYKRRRYREGFKAQVCELWPGADPAFWTLPVKQQLQQLQRGPTGDEASDAALRSLRAFPDAFYDLALPPEVVSSILEQQAGALEAKLESAIVVRGRAALLASAHTLLASDNVYHALVAAALCTGRRFGELVGYAHFDNDGLFHGQLKRKGAPPAPYVVPLLCPLEALQAALARMRDQLNPARTKTLAELHSRYSSQTNVVLKQVAATAWASFLDKGDKALKFHDLRAIYTALAWEARPEEDRSSFNSFAKRVLGHASLQQTLNYSSCVCRGN